MRNKMSNIAKNESGATTISYGIIAALIGTALIGGLTTVGNENAGTYFNLTEVITWGGGDDGLNGDGGFGIDKIGEILNIRGHRHRVESIEGWDSSHPVEIKYDGISGLHTSTNGSWIDMTADRGENQRLETAVAGLIPGEVYTLTFEAASFYAATSEMVVSFGGQQLEVIQSPTNTGFETYSIEIVGGSGDGANGLVFEEVGNDNDYYGTGLANVMVERSS